MIRYVILDGDTKRYVLHAFTSSHAVVEDVATGKVSLVDPGSLTFDPPTQVMVEQQMRAQAANPLAHNLRAAN